MDKDIRFSIVTPIYNHAHHFQRFLSSVHPQIIDGDELILIDDCSTDELPILTKEIEDSCPWVTVVRNRERRGPAWCRNLGVNMAKNVWIKFLDADDMLIEPCFQQVRPLLVDMEPCVCVGKQIYAMPPSGRCRYTYIEPKFESVVQCNPFVPSMTFIHWELFNEVGGFDERIEFEEDWDLWLKIWKKYGLDRFKFIDVFVDQFNNDNGERTERDKNRSHLVDGVDVREYLKRTYGVNPIGV